MTERGRGKGGSVTASDAEANRREAGEACNCFAPALHTRLAACIVCVCVRVPRAPFF